MPREHAGLSVEVLVEPSFQQNGLVVWATGQRDCWIIDPGFPPQPEQMLQVIRHSRLNVAAIVLTHCHPDHIAGVAPLKAALPAAPLIAPRAEQHMLADAEANLSAAMGLEITTPPADHLIGPGDSLTLGPLAFEVLDVAGHSPGGLAYYCKSAGVVIAGDALFHGSIGRYDFPGSSRRTLLTNIKKHLLTLPDETALYSGHGPESTIGEEKRHNLVLRMELGE